MDEEEILYFNKALESIEESQLALENEKYNLSINRSYYAVFYATKALLIKKGIETKKHSGTIHKFGLEYVVNGNFDSEIAKSLKNLENDRTNADYDVHLIFSKEDALYDLKNAQTFIEECKKFLFSTWNNTMTTISYGVSQNNFLCIHFISIFLYWV